MIKPRTQTGQLSGDIAVDVDGECPVTATTTSTTTTFRGYRGIVDQVAQRAVAG
jgi:hypothetical protein